MFSWIARAYNWVTGKIDNTIAGWVHDLITGLYGFLHTIFGTVISAWNDFWRAVRLARIGIHDFTHAVASAWDYLWRVYIPHFLHWINVHILRPLTDAWHWISHEGTTLWYYLTHPSKLVDLIWRDVLAKLESTAWETGAILGKFFLSLFARNLSKVIKLIEDVVDAVL